MKIAVIVPNIGMSAAAVDERRAYLAAHARPGTEILFHVNEHGPRSIETLFEANEAGVEIVRTIQSLSRQGMDAFIPWCGSDPGMEVAREITTVPVVGPGHAALHYASMLGSRITWLAPMGDPRRIRARVQSYALLHKLAAVKIIGTPVLELRRDLERTRTRIEGLLNATAKDVEADAAILGCMALFGMASTLKTQVPVVDPALSALLMAETLVTMGLSHMPSSPV